jgi:alpha-ketoglutarate-dependent taurine dioxygenase
VERAEHVGAAYRHDYVSANRYFAEILDGPPPERLSAPVTVVVAADDPTTAGFRARHRDWELLAEHVELHELAGGGHYFPRTRPAEAGQAVLQSAGMLVPHDRQTERSRDVVVTPGIAARCGTATWQTPILRAEEPGDAPRWAAEHREALRAVVAEHGAVLVRGLGLHDAAGTTAVFQRLASTLMIEKEAFARRQVYADGVYSSATWPANQQMCMHHELSYRLEVPSLLLFACLGAPTRGGATAVSDSPTVLDALPKELTARFEREGWLLARSYNDEIGATLAEAFGTEDRIAIESYCRANAIEFAWQPDGELRTRQRRSAVVHHPVTEERCFFNQIAFLNGGR